MFRKLNHFLNIAMGVCIGIFIGSGIYEFWNYKTHPDLYAMWSAPWYITILVHGIFLIIISGTIIGIKLIIYFLTRLGVIDKKVNKQ